MRTLAFAPAPVVLAVFCCADAAPPIDAADHGAVGDGQTDDTAAIQAALDAAADGPHVVTLPPGAYLISAELNIPPGVTLTGMTPRWEDGSTTILVKENGFSAVRLNNFSNVRAVAFSYPNNHNGDDPDAYPPTVLLAGLVVDPTNPLPLTMDADHTLNALFTEYTVTVAVQRVHLHEKRRGLTLRMRRRGSDILFTPPFRRSPARVPLRPRLAPLYPITAFSVWRPGHQSRSASSSRSITRVNHRLKPTTHTISDIHT